MDKANSSSNTTKIPVHIIKGNAFIWDPEDVITLRTKYRIVGSLVGLLPKNPLQNIFSSLPLLLLPEEVSLLLEKGYIYLIDDRKTHRKPTSEDIKHFNEEQEKLKQKDNMEFLKQKNAHLQKNKNKIKNKNILGQTSNESINTSNSSINSINNIDNSTNSVNNDVDNNSNNIADNNTIQNEDKNINNSDKSNINNNSNDDNSETNDKEKIKDKANTSETIENTATTEIGNENVINSTKDNNTENEALNNNKENNSSSTENINIINNKNNTNNSNSSLNDKGKKKNNEKEKTHLIHIQTNSKNLPWYNPSYNNNKYECYTLEEARTKNIWTYPNTSNEKQKYKIFCDIWEKPENYYITSGSKYGSDYLIYPGDPIQYHSNFIATVIYDTDFEYSPKYIIKYGRLGTNVKKTHLLCNIDKKTNLINYYSIEWSSWI